jgi:hypothetical protein
LARDAPGEEITMTIELPFWLRNTIIFGREKDEDKGEEGDGEGDDGEDDGEESGEGEGGEGGSSSDGDDTEGLKKALVAERREKRKLERENKRLKKAQDSSKQDEEKDLAETKKSLSTEQEKTRKLAARLLNGARDAAILKVARDLGFIDETDALTDDIRQAVDVDQDDEDPSEIDIDEDSVKRAVKALATKKKHLVGEVNDEERSGSKYRRDKKVDEKTADEKLKDMYPSLR